MIWVRRESESSVHSVLLSPNVVLLWPHVNRFSLKCGHMRSTFLGMKSEMLKARVSVSEKNAFQEAADLAGIPLSTWVRERLRHVAIRELEGAGIPVHFVRRVPMKEPGNG